MSHSFKDQANYIRHHEKVDATSELKEKAELMELHHKGERLGNQRKAQAHLKVVERRNERARSKSSFKRALARDLE